MFWEPGPVQRHLGVIDLLTQKILKVPECHLGGPYRLEKERRNHPAA